MIDERFVEVLDRREREFQHHLFVGGQSVQLGENFVAQDGFSLGFVGDGDVHFGFDDRHQTVRKNLHADFKLLGDDGFDAFGVGGVDHRAFLGAKDAFGHGAGEKGVELWHRFHQLNAVCLVCEPFVDFQERHDRFCIPEEFSGRGAVDVAVHGHFKEDCADDFFAGEGRGFDDPRPHLVDHVEHLGVAVVFAFFDTVEAQGLGGRTATLVESCDKAFAFGYLSGHLRVHY